MLIYDDFDNLLTDKAVLIQARMVQNNLIYFLLLQYVKILHWTLSFYNIIRVLRMITILSRRMLLLYTLQKSKQHDM